VVPTPIHLKGIQHANGWTLRARSISANLNVRGPWRMPLPNPRTGHAACE